MSTADRLRRGLFLDRDGVINEEVGYLHRPEDCRLIEGIVPLLQTANQLGFVTCVVTNQAGIARGLYTEADFHALMAYMQEELLRQGARLDAVYFSPYHPVHGVGFYKRESDCRKPGPGMLLQAAREQGIDLSRSVLVGDRCSDLQAGEAAGIPDLFLFDNTGGVFCPEPITYHLANTLFTVQNHLVATTRR